MMPFLHIEQVEVFFLLNNKRIHSPNESEENSFFFCVRRSFPSLLSQMEIPSHHKSDKILSPSEP